jgi:hypothetical protein
VLPIQAGQVRINLRFAMPTRSIIENKALRPARLKRPLIVASMVRSTGDFTARNVRQRY